MGTLQGLEARLARYSHLEGNGCRTWHGRSRIRNYGRLKINGRNRPPNNRGERHGAAKLTEDRVRQIRMDRRRYRQIAADHGISASVVCLVKARRAWGHVA